MILDRLLGKPKRLATKIPGRSISETPGVLLSRRQTAAGVAVDETEALSLSGVFAAVQLLSSIIGALPLSVFRKSDKTREVADDLQVHGVLHDEYNPEMTAVVGRRTSEFHRLLWGNEYAEIQRMPDEDVFALWPLEPWRVRAKRNESGALGWLVDGQRWVADAKMVHVPLISFDGVEGKCFVDFALKSLGLGISMQDFSERFIANDARPGGMLTNPGSPSKAARKEFRDEFMEAHKDPGIVGAMWGGWTYAPGTGTMELEKVQLLESKRFQIEEVARWFNLPPHLIRDLSRSTNNNIEHQGIDFVTYSLNPPLVMKEQEYNRKLLKRLGKDLYCKHNVAALMRGDQSARSAFYREMFGIGVYSQNMILELEDQNPIEGGDVHYVPANMMSIEKANAPPKPEPAPAPTPAPAPAPTPAPTPKPEEKPAPDLRPILADVFERLGRKHANEARRAAKKPEQFIGWLDEFYPKFEATMAQAISPIDDNNADAIAADYCSTARELMLDIAGSAKPQELFGLVDLKLNEWALMFPIGWAAKALEKINAKV